MIQEGKTIFHADKKTVQVTSAKQETSPKQDSSFFAEKNGKKLIAVELAPPLG